MGADRIRRTRKRIREPITFSNPPSKLAPEGYEWPREHSLFVDHDGNAWMGCNDTIDGNHCAVVTKFTNDGKLIWQKGKTGQSKGNTDTENFGEPRRYIRRSDNERGVHR